MGWVNLTHSVKFIAEVLLPLCVGVLQVWLAVLLGRRGAVGYFRFFFAYIVFAIIAGLLKFFALQAAYTVFYYTFLSTEPIYALLGYLAIAEVFYHIFRNFYRIWWFRFLFPTFGLLALGVSVFIAVVRPPVQATPFLATVFVFEIIVRCLQLGVFFLIFGLAKLYGLYWRQYSFGIAAGFGIAAFGLLLTFVLRSIFGTKHAFMFQLISQVTYLLALLVWLVSFLKPLPPDPLQEVRRSLTPEMLQDLYEQYRRQVRDIFKQCLEPYS